MSGNADARQDVAAGLGHSRGGSVLNCPRVMRHRLDLAQAIRKIPIGCGSGVHGFAAAAEMAGDTGTRSFHEDGYFGRPLPVRRMFGANLSPTSD